MKPLDYLYFNIYNHYQQKSQDTGPFLARFQAMYLLSLSAGGWVLLLQTTYLRILKHSWFTSKGDAMIFAISIYLLMALVFHRIFIVNEHDQKIIGKYERAWNSNPNKKRDLMISVFIMVVPYILLLSLSTFFPRES